DTATVPRPRPASSPRSTSWAACPAASTMPTATRLATEADSVSTSLVARLGSSPVARAAVTSADSGHTPSQTVPQNTIAVASQPTDGAYCQFPRATVRPAATDPI